MWIVPLSDTQNSVLKSHSIIPSKLFTEWKIWWITNGCPWKRKEYNIWSAVCNPRSTTNSGCSWELVKVKCRGESDMFERVSRSVSRCDDFKETHPEIFALPCLRRRYTHGTESLQGGDCTKHREGLRNSPALKKPRKFWVLVTHLVVYLQWVLWPLPCKQPCHGLLNCRGTQIHLVAAWFFPCSSLAGTQIQINLVAIIAFPADFIWIENRGILT